MITLGDALKVRHVVVDLDVSHKMEAIEHLLGLLRGDKRVLSADGLKEGILNREREGDTDLGHELALPHARTAAVSGIVMAWARLRNTVTCHQEMPVRHVILIGLPEALASDYLRMVGMLIRLFRDDETRRTLNDMSTSEAMRAFLLLKCI